MDTDYRADKAWLLNIQRKLYTWSRGHPDEGWRDMWNWVTDPQNLRLAWHRIASNRGARSAGVDGLTVKRIKQRIGVGIFLTDLQRQLRSGSYRASPVRRVLIPKHGKTGQFRPLGVPTVTDRVTQAAILNLLEPIFEAQFYSVSYGFRPKRACRDALEHIRAAIRPPKSKAEPGRYGPPYQWIIEGDIKACFDEIDHHVVMERVRKRIVDVKVCRLVRNFLKAGVLAEEVFLRTETGTPQGGILSPILANVVLSAIEERYQRFVAPRPKQKRTAITGAVNAARDNRYRERKAGRPVFLPVRYADDFVVLVSGTEAQARNEKEALAHSLRRELKLTLSEEKTRVTALTEGFQFLGHRVFLRWDNRWGYWPRIEIPKERVNDLRYRIKQMTNRGHSHLTFQEVIDSLNPVLRGWGNFYRHCYGAKATFTRIDHYVWDRLSRWLRKKYPKAGYRRRQRRFWRRMHNRPRSCWMEQRPVVIMADIKVGRHNLKSLRYPDYALKVTGELGAQRKVHAEFGNGGRGNRHG